MSNTYICTNRHPSYKYAIDKIINSRKKEIFDFFMTEENEDFKFNVYIYDTNKELIEEMKKRGFDDMPSYMCACHKDEDNSLNFFEPKEHDQENWSKQEYENVIFHELVHGIEYVIYKEQPEWLTEGIAKYLDGTYKKGIKYLMDNYINKREIPSMDELNNEFGKHDYDSYDYAYIMISYLIEALGKEKFIKRLNKDPKLEEFKDNLITKAINFYKRKYYS